MDNSPIKVTKVIVPEEIQVNLADLPNIISDKIQLMDKLDKKVQNAQKAAKVAEEKAKELKGFKEKKFLWMKWKSGDTKENVEGTQSAVSALAEAQKASADAQDLSFKFQKELADTSEYLFYLGCYNIAANESMIANLNEQLKSGSVNGVLLSAKVKEQFRNVVKRLVEQKDVLYRQQKIEEKAKFQDGELQKLNDELKKREEEAKDRDKKISEQSGQISELEKTLKQKDQLDEKQTCQIEKLISLLKAKDVLDEEQSKKIKALEEKVATINDELEKLSQKLNSRTIALCVLSIIAIVMAIIGLIGF